jgi:hypothetical protein
MAVEGGDRIVAGCDGGKSKRRVKACIEWRLGNLGGVDSLLALTDLPSVAENEPDIFPERRTLWQHATII